MHDLVAQLSAILRGMWKQRWVALAVAWPVLIAGLAIVHFLPDRYASSGRIYVDTQSVLRPLMSGMTVLPNLEQQVAMMSRTLISRPNVEKVVRMADLDLRVSDARAREQLLELVQRDIKLAAAGNNLYTISFTHTNANAAQRVVQSLMSIFVEGSLGDNKKDAEVARRFIEEQIQAYEKKLTEAENRVKDFKLKHMGSLPGSGADYFARMQETGSRLEKARVELKEAENARDALRRQLAGEEPVLIDDVTPPPAPAQAAQSAPPPSRRRVEVTREKIEIPTRASAALEARIDSLRQGIDQLLLKYTNEHPDVVAGKRLLAQLEAQREEELGILRARAEAAQRAADARAEAAQRAADAQAAEEAQAAAAAAAAAEAAAAAAAAAARSASAKPASARALVANNPVIQQLKVAFAEAEANVASKQARVRAYEGEYANLRNLAGSLPQIEADFAQLNRDYEVHRQNYKSLLSRRESAMLSGQMDATTPVVDFRIVEPPRVSPKPVAPNRPLLVSAAFGVALAAGIGVTFLLTQLRPMFHDTRALRAVTSRPMLGSVSMIWTPARRRRARLALASFIFAFLALLGVYGGGLAYFLLYTARTA